MQLAEITKRNMKDLLRKYQEIDRIVDLEFINEVMEILNADPQMDGRLKYEVRRKWILTPSSRGGDVSYFDINKIRLFVARFPDLYREMFDESYDAIIANIFALFNILHKVYEKTYRMGMTGYEELDRVYYDLYQKLDNLSMMQKKRYLRNQKSIIDRNARVEALRELIDVNMLSRVCLIPTLQYFEEVLSGYENGVISPMHANLEYLGLDFSKYDFDKMPFGESLEQGITEDADNITKVSDLRKDFFEDRKAYDEAYKELRKVQ